MSGFLAIIFMSALLGSASFAVGMLPLLFTFSKTRIEYLSTVGSGLLLGAALGIIIPEGVETLVAESSKDDGLITIKISLSLLCGFAFMLLVEQFMHTSGGEHQHQHSHSPLPTSEATRRQSLIFQVSDGEELDQIGKTRRSSDEAFDLALNELESHDENGVAARGETAFTNTSKDGSAEMKLDGGRSKAFPLTLGLVIHSLADGLALGASALPRQTADGEPSQTDLGLSIVVFLALIVHKAPTALALSMSLLSTSLPRSECKKHIAFFSISTPIGAIATFCILSIIGSKIGGGWTGIALLISGGTFLYVATVIQPTGSSNSSDMNEKVRTGLVVFGMFVPFLLSLLVEHGH